MVSNAPPEVTNPDPTPSPDAPTIDSSNPTNLLVPAVDGEPITIDLDDYLTDPNGDSVTISPDALPAGATFDPLTNELTFVPPVNNNGDTVVSFTVTVSNGATVTPTVTIQPVNPVPQASNETISAPYGSAVEIDPLANDTDEDGDELTISHIHGVSLTPGIAQTIEIPNATITIDTAGAITVTPDIGFSGDVVVDYIVADEDGVTDTATHTVDVANAPPSVEDIDTAPGTPVIDPVDTQNILVPAVDGEPVTIDLDEYLVDPNGDQITIDPGSLPEGATFDAATNALTFIPATDNTGDKTVPLTVTDTAGNTITPVVTIQPVNPDPIANPQAVETPFGTPVKVDLLANDIDPDSDVISLGCLLYTSPSPRDS